MLMPWRRWGLVHQLRGQIRVHRRDELGEDGLGLAVGLAVGLGLGLAVGLGH